MDVEIPCVCGHHQTDTVTLRERLDFHGALAVRNEVVLLKSEHPGADSSEMYATLYEGYLLHGIEAWTLLEDGEPIAVNADAVRTYLLPHVGEASAVAEAADDLYQAVMLPLLMRAFRSSPPTRTDGSTSARNGSRTKRPKPSSPSSTMSTPTDATATTTSSPAGVSS